MTKEFNIHALGLDASVAVADAVAAAREFLPAILEGEEKLSISEAIMLIGCASMWFIDIKTEIILDMLQDIQSSIDCAGVITPVFWMNSDIAAIDKAKELGIDILPEYSIADLRYKIDIALREVL